MYKIFNHQNDQLPPQVNQSPCRHPELVSGSKGFVNSHVAFYTHEILNQVQHDKARAHVGFYTPKTLNQVQGDELRIGLRAFTLAEVMIVLVVIGILTAILLPVAHNATPNEDIIKFKKAHNTLHVAIRELVNSDKYYLNGDLGVKPDGTLVDSNANIEHTTYFCKTLSDVLNIKQVNCSNSRTGAVYYSIDSKYMPDGQTDGNVMDSSCETYSDVGEEIILDDDVIVYQTCPYYSFGIMNEWVHGGATPNTRMFKDYPSEDGFVNIYKIICIDIDGLNQGESAFGYGVRYDGKIITGAKADEWLEKSIQDKN